jgi:hypothetical protein
MKSVETLTISDDIVIESVSPGVTTPPGSSNEVLRKLILDSVLYPNIAQNLDEAVLYNPDTGRMRSDISEKTIKRVLGDDWDNYLKTNVQYASHNYNPYTDSVFSHDSDGVVRVNTYVPPFARFRNYHFKETIPNAELPKIYYKLFSHLTDKNARSMQYIVYWLASALKGKCPTFLCLIAAEGIGKGVFATVCQALFGEDNARIISDSVFNGRFNGQLKNLQLAICNEFKLESDASLDKAKSVIDDSIELEQKGKDAVTYKNMASFLFISNRDDSVKIEGKARRWSIVDLTDKNLLDELDPKAFTIAEIESLTDPKNIEVLYRFLWNLDIPIDMHKPFHSDRFSEIKESQLKGWERYLLNWLNKKSIGDQIPVSDITAELSGKCGLDKAPGFRPIKALASNYSDYIEVTRPKKLNKFILTIKAKIPISEDTNEVETEVYEF